MLTNHIQLICEVFLHGQCIRMIPTKPFRALHQNLLIKIPCLALTMSALRWTEAMNLVVVDDGANGEQQTGQINLGVLRVVMPQATLRSANGDLLRSRRD